MLTEFTCELMGLDLHPYSRFLTSIHFIPPLLYRFRTPKCLPFVSQIFTEIHTNYLIIYRIFSVFVTNYEIQDSEFYTVLTTGNPGLAGDVPARSATVRQ